MEGQQVQVAPVGGLLVLFFYCWPFLLLFGAWLIYWLGGRSRRRHLDEQEAHFRSCVCVTNLKRFPAGGCVNAQLVTGSAAIANNYFVSFLAAFRHLFGGEMKGYTQMCDEARRLAVVRMLQEAEAAGCNWFLTTDGGILKKIRTLGTLKIANPIDFIMETRI